MPASSFLSGPSSTAVFAFTWHPVLSRVWGEMSSWQGESVLAVSPLLPPPCSPPIAGFAIKMWIQFELGGCRVERSGKPRLLEQEGLLWDMGEIHQPCFQG